MRPTPSISGLAFCAALTITASLSAAPQNFPGATWPTATPESQGLDSAVLTQGFDALGWPAKNGPILVIANGREVFRVGDPAKTEYVFSCSKAVTAMVCARLRQQGLITSFDDLVPNAHHSGAWAGYPGDSSYRRFMTMTSDYGLSPYHPVGDQYAYNNNAIDFYGESMSKQFYGNQVDQMHLTVDTALTSITGKQDALSFTGQWGGWGGGLKISARDFARLGYLILQGGKWNNQQLLHSEFINGLFRSQLPSGAARYAGAPTMNNEVNQQWVTDLMAGSWSFGLWRVGDADAQGNWPWAAAEGFRGKRLILCPKGSLPDPNLEVVLVCLPHLPDEGPSSLTYVDILEQAAEALLPDIPETPDNIAATFEDGQLHPLENRGGTQTIRGGDWLTSTASRALLAGHSYQDLDALIQIAPDMPRGSAVGLVLRAAQAADWGLVTDGPQSFLWLTRDANDQYKLRLRYYQNQQPITVERLLTVPIAAGEALEMLVLLRGDTLSCRINGEQLFGAAGHSGIPDPVGGGLLSLWASGNGAEVGVQHLLVRPADSPQVYLTKDQAGDHQVVMFGSQFVHSYRSTDLTGVVGPVLADGALLHAAQPWLWPTVLGIGGHHCLLSSAGAPYQMPTGTQVVLNYRGTFAGILTP